MTIGSSTTTVEEYTTTSTHQQQYQQQQHEVVHVESRRLRLQRQMIVLGVISSAGLGVFFLAILPMAAIVAWIIFVTSFGLLSRTGVQRLQLEYQQIVAGQGLGRYLPAALYRYLTEESLHQFLTQDNSSAQEYVLMVRVLFYFIFYCIDSRLLCMHNSISTFHQQILVHLLVIYRWGFLALYMIPGLTQEQLNQYVQRLAPERQQFLNRPGLGYLLGERFMRAVVGEQQWRRHAIESSIPRVVQPQPQPPFNQQRPLQITAENNNPVRRLDFDSDSESLASQSPMDRLVAFPAMNNNPGNPMNLATPLTPVDVSNSDDNSGTSEERRQRQLDEEGDVILSAVFTAWWSGVSWLAGEAGEAVYEAIVEPFSSLVSVAGIGVSVLSLGMGMWGLSTGLYHRPQIRGTNTFQASSLLPSSQVLVSTALFGGVTAGVILYARTTMRNAVNAHKKTPPPSSSKRRTQKGGDSKK